MQSELMTKMEKLEKSKTATGITDLKDKVKSGEVPGMETNQIKELDTLLNQSISKQDNRPPSPFDSKDT